MVEKLLKGVDYSVWTEIEKRCIKLITFSIYLTSSSHSFSIHFIQTYHQNQQWYTVAAASFCCHISVSHSYTVSAICLYAFNCLFAVATSVFLCSSLLPTVLLHFIRFSISFCLRGSFFFSCIHHSICNLMVKVVAKWTQTGCHELCVQSGVLCTANATAHDAYVCMHKKR